MWRECRRVVLVLGLDNLCRPSNHSNHSKYRLASHKSKYPDSLRSPRTH